MMDLGVHWGTHIPKVLGDIDGEVREERIEGVIPLSQAQTQEASLTLRRFFPTQEGLSQLAEALKCARREALAISIDERIAIFDALAQGWLASDAPTPTQPSSLALAIACVTGFSPGMVDHALYLEQVSSQGPHLRRALRGELGNEYALDGFVPSPLRGGSTMAIGPELVGSVTSANIPGLPHLEVMRALLVKGACLAKVPSGEPIFLAHYARALEAANPALGACLAVVALDRKDGPIQGHFASILDYLTVYGGVPAIQSWRGVAKGVKRTWHGHKLGVAALSRESISGEDVSPLLGSLAYDFSLYDQEACLSPTALYIEEGGTRSPRDIAKALGAPMAQEAHIRPPRRMDLPQKAAQRRYIEGRLMAGAALIDAPKGWPYIILLDPDPTFGPNAPGRILRVCPIPSLEALPTLLAPLGAYLQNAVVEAPPTRRGPIARAMASLGLSRLTRPGMMGTPSMMWHHDGAPCLSRMVRFCDEETLKPEEWAQRAVPEI